MYVNKDIGNFERLERVGGGKGKRSKNFDKGDFNENRKGEGKDRKEKYGKRGKKEEYKGEWRKEKIA